MSDTINFTINGEAHDVGAGGEVTATTTLQKYLHGQFLTGSKGTCLEGSCGACIVVADIPDPNSGDRWSGAVNSCLVPILACDGWQITTVEGLGNQKDGLHVIQETLAKKSGSQCGYCSPGFVMKMYGLTKSQPTWTEEDIESHIDGGNLCRCTGYRPILQAFKSIPVTETQAGKGGCCRGGGGGCCRQPGNKVKSDTKVKSIVIGGATWYYPTTLEDLQTTLAGLAADTKYQIVCGDTVKAVYKTDGPYTAFIYTRMIPDMSRSVIANDSMVIGADVSITRLISELSEAGDSLSGFAYLKNIAETWKAVASTSVRNMGSWGGNIAAKVLHPEFPSDIFLGLLVAGAVITTGGPDGSLEKYNLEELLEVDLVGRRRVILDVVLTPASEDTVVRTFKIPPRPSNTHAQVNAGFRLQVDATNAHTVTGSPIIAYGGVNPSFVRAKATEEALKGMSLEDEVALQGALEVLAGEVIPDNKPEDASPEYRVALTQNLLYKTILGIIGDVAASTLTSGATNIIRPNSSAKQTFDQNTDVWPLAEPVMKLEAPIQCSGEAEFIELMPRISQEHYGWFVTSTQANATIVSVDATSALAVSGVVTFLSAKDITGVNNIQVMATPEFAQPLFAEGRTGYYGQPIGLIVATTTEIAQSAASLVVVTYDDPKPPVLTIDEALKKPLPPGQFDPFVEGDVDAGFAASTHIIEGELRHGGQYHFHLENQVTLAIPTEDGLDVHAGSQWIAGTQMAIGQVLGIPDNSVNVTVKRIGGGFGAKIDQCNIISTAAALAATTIRKPVKIVVDLDTNMTIYGGRDPFYSTYKVGVDDQGLLQAVQATITSDSGYTGTDPNCPLAPDCVPSCYACPNFLVTPQFVLTNTSCNTYCRTPGTFEGVTLMEEILDHVAATLNIDPIDIRKRNLMLNGSTMRVNHCLLRARARLAGKEALAALKAPLTLTVPKNFISDMIDQLMTSADVDARKQAVAEFNQANRWKKRGIALMSMSWPHSVDLRYPFSVLVSINARDGSVAVSHGGTEMGQGINTKVAQVAAYQLKANMDVVTIRPTNTHVNANSSCTCGSKGSDVASYSVSEACKIIRARLDEVEASVGKKLPWKELILTAWNMGVNLSEKYENGPGEVKSYAVFGVACSEVELDVLTGQYLVTRTDLIEDAGRSLSPLVDVGQVEGGFIMGQGLLTTEKPIYDPTTGKKLSAGTWNYYIPTSHDIPADFRVTLLSNAPNPIGVLSSKVTAEPPVTLSFSIVMALRQAIASARKDAGTPGWFNMNSPLTVEVLQRLCLVDPSSLVIH